MLNIIRNNDIHTNLQYQMYLIAPRTLNDFIDMGALASRISRSSDDVETIYKNEFKKNKNRSTEFYQKVFIEYGDGSVADMCGGGIMLIFQNIPIWWSTILLKYRLLGAIEKSTRYIKVLDVFRTGDSFLDQNSEKQLAKFNVEYSRYYQSLYDKQFGKRKPDTKDQPMIRAMKANALDNCRHLLPLSTLTTVAITANIREWVYMLQKETFEVEDKEQENAYHKFIKNTTNFIRKYFEVFFRHFDPKYSSRIGGDPIKLNWTDKNPYPNSTKNHVKLINYNIFPYDVFTRLKNFNYETRESKFDKVNRELENTTFTFLINTDIGTFRDIHRHRMCTIYNVNFFAFQYSEYSYAYQYVDRVYNATLGDRVQFTMHINLRELIHLVELRTQQAGHFDYRDLAQKMALCVAQMVDDEHWNGFDKPKTDVSDIFRFINKSPPTKEFLSRLDSEKKIHKKIMNFGKWPK